jgi:hypothetical protein
VLQDFVEGPVVEELASSGSVTFSDDAWSGNNAS